MQSAHPHFVSSIQWYADLDAAKADAAGRHILVVHGSRLCLGTRGQIEKTINKEEIADYVRERFLCVASDADATRPEIEALLAELPQRSPTPVCIYLSSEGRVVHSTAGGRPAAVFLNDLMRAASR